MALLDLRQIAPGSHTPARRARLSLARWRILPLSRERYLSLARWRLRAIYFGQRLAHWRLLGYYRSRYLVARRLGRPGGLPRHPGGRDRNLSTSVTWCGRSATCWASRSGRSRPPARATFGWAWKDATTNDPVPGAINGDCTDISKSRVDAAMRRVFGYGAEIDPTTHEGMCVRKSEVNTAHDGRIVQCPTEPEPGYVYQRLVDTQVGHDEVEEWRVVKVGSKVPLRLP